ncbi:MAG: hypothetical protein JST36_03055 [Bacteroidetes bacterium]|nr:hypothetical protein [Bacteroidota bacterium]
MANVKLGKITVKDFVAEKPIGVRGDGTLLYPKELLSKKEAPSMGLELKRPELKIKLALSRLKAEPDFKFGVLDKVGAYSKAEVLQHIENQTPIGKQFMDIEVQYAEYFANQLMGKPEKLILPTISRKLIKDPVVAADWRAIPKAKWPFFKSKVLFCENTTDSVTNQAATYRIANVHPVFAAKGFQVEVLKGVDDIRANFIPKAKESRMVYISGIGHGSYTAYTGHGFNHILDVNGYDAAEVNGKIIHFLSCETGRSLGPNTVSKGAKAYLGYDENFVFDWANSTLYWQCDSQFDISMANGKTVEQAIADTVAKYNAAIASVPGTSTAATLLSDRNLMRSPVNGASWGSKTAKIYSSLIHYMSFAQYIQMH